MITGCLTVIFIIIAIALIVALGIVVLPFIAVIYFISSYSLYKKSLKLEASKMECPNCGSTDVKIKSLKTGDERNNSISGVGAGVGILRIGTIGGKSKTQYTYKREGICQKCGFNYDYLIQDDIDNMKKNAKTRYIVSIIFLIFAIFIFVGFMMSSNSENSTSNSSSITNSEELNSVWATEITPIDDFEYYIEGDNVYIKKYKGNNKKVKINNIYTINGKDYTVTSFTEGVFALKSVDSVILPEGLTSMPNNTFNSCGVEFVYIPSTLQSDGNSYSFYSYFHDVEKIYYGGTEEQWKILTNNVDRSKIDVKEIIYNANLNDLK